MQGYHSILQRGEETEAVLSGYVQTEMLWVLFTWSGFHLVAVGSYNHTTFCKTDGLHGTNEKYILKGHHLWVDASRNAHIYTGQASVQLFHLLKGTWTEPQKSGRMKGLYFLIWTQPPNMKTCVHYVDQMEFLDFSAKTEHYVYSDMYSLYSLMVAWPKKEYHLLEKAYHCCPVNKT